MGGAKAQRPEAVDAFTWKVHPLLSIMPVPPMKISPPTVDKARHATGTPRHGGDGTVRVVRPQVSSLVFTSGTLTIDSDKGEISHSDGSFLLGEFSNKTYTAWRWHGLHLPSGHLHRRYHQLGLRCGDQLNSVSKAVSLRTRNHGNLTLGHTINVNGGNDPLMWVDRESRRV